MKLIILTGTYAIIDFQEALARTKNYLEQLETRNMELKQKLRASKEQWELVDNY